MGQKAHRRYSECFKRKVAGEVDAGKWSSIKRAAEVYGIPYQGSITRWLRKYSKQPPPEVLYIMSPDEKDELQKLQSRIKELEQALAYTQVDNVMNESYLKIACRDLGVEDIEDFKKKAASKLSP